MNIVNQMILLTVQHENDSQTRLVVGCEDKARTLYHKLVHLGYPTAARTCPREHVPARDAAELARGNALMNEAYHKPIPSRVLP